MGTLFSQKPRNNFSIDDIPYQFEDAVQYLSNISKKQRINFCDLVYLYEVMELTRKNDLYVANGDIKDEQLKGFGEILRDFVEHCSSVDDAIQHCSEAQE